MVTPQQPGMMAPIPGSAPSAVVTTASPALPPGKTPISFLQELCTKRGYTPSYDLIANEGPVHEPMFVFRVTCGEFKGSGKGTSKRHAKHAAAQSCLNKLLGLPNGTNVEEPVPAEATYNPAQTVDGLAGNPIGQLQELTQKRLWRPPIYEFTSEQGPPHAREFVCNIKLHTTIETGTGKSKKVAKRNAAELMLQRIKAGIPEPPPEEDGDDGPARKKKKKNPKKPKDKAKKEMTFVPAENLGMEQQGNSGTVTDNTSFPATQKGDTKYQAQSQGDTNYQAQAQGNTNYQAQAQGNTNYQAQSGDTSAYSSYGYVKAETYHPNNYNNN